MTAGRTVALVWLRCQVYCRAETVDGRHNSRGAGGRSRLLPFGYYRCRLDLEMCRGDQPRLHGAGTSQEGEFGCVAK